MGDGNTPHIDQYDASKMPVSSTKKTREKTPKIPAQITPSRGDFANSTDEVWRR
jgi:hypothetical protein